MFDHEINKLRWIMNDNFKIMNSVILEDKNFNFPEDNQSCLELINDKFLADCNDQSVWDNKAKRNMRKNFEQNKSVLNPDTKHFLQTVPWERCHENDIVIKSQLKYLDDENNLLEEYKSEVVDVSDNQFVNKFAIMMHKYENVIFFI